MNPLTAEDLQTTLLNAIETIADARMEITHDRALADLMRDLIDDTGDLEDAASFREARVPTGDAGLVIRLADGSEFQITIVQSRPANPQ